MVARVFVSHASDGLDQANEVYGWLAEAGHEVFLDRSRRDGIGVGEEWRQQLHERLRWADAVVCVVTSAYVSSTWCTVEAEIARSRGSKLLPVYVERGVIEPSLEGFFGDPLSSAKAEEPLSLRVLAAFTELTLAI